MRIKTLWLALRMWWWCARGHRDLSHSRPMLGSGRYRCPLCRKPLLVVRSGWGDLPQSVVDADAAWLKGVA